MNKIISIPFEAHFEEIGITEDHERQHLLDIKIPDDLSIFRGGLVEILWKQHNDPSCFKNTYLPIHSKNYLFSNEIKGFYDITTIAKIAPSKVIFVFNLNDFFLPIYALSQSLSLINKDNLTSKEIFILFTHDIDYCPMDYVIQFMKVLSEFFGTIPEILTLSELIKRSSLYDYSFHIPGIDWLTLDSSMGHLLLSKGAYPLRITEHKNTPNRYFKFSPFHEIELYNVEANDFLYNSQLVAPRFIKSQLKLFSGGKLHKPTNIPYNFFQMIFN